MASLLGETFLRHALVEVVLLGVIAGWAGVWVVLYGISYGAESVAHGMFPGLVVASIAGVPLALGGAAGALATAALVALVVGQRGIDRDTATGAVVTTTFAVGAIVALSRDVPPSLERLLFGDVLAVSTPNLLETGLLGSLAVGTLWLAHPRLAAVGFDRAAARSLGVRTRAVELVALTAVAATALIATRALGSLLAVAALVAPAAAARLLVHRIRPMIAVSTALGILGGVAGLALSAVAGTAAGASIALCQVAIVTVAMATRRRDTPDTSRAGRRRARRSSSRAATRAP
jgi:ABC-type Mn2+/Zn2+ transport system permease subunit